MEDGRTLRKNAEGKIFGLKFAPLGQTLPSAAVEGGERQSSPQPLGLTTARQSG
jgi:hypothetical protein